MTRQRLDRAKGPGSKLTDHERISRPRKSGNGRPLESSLA
jgi:hypothetical protein